MSEYECEAAATARQVFDSTMHFVFKVTVLGRGATRKVIVVCMIVRELLCAVVEVSSAAEREVRGDEV